MTGDRAHWVAKLVAGLHLRGRASHSEYRLGRALAEADAVRLVTLDPGVVISLVADGALHRVVLKQEHDAIVATCSCGAARQACRHAVAVEHAIWLRFASQPADARPPDPARPERGNQPTPEPRPAESGTSSCSSDPAGPDEVSGGSQ